MDTSYQMETAEWDFLFYHNGSTALAVIQEVFESKLSIHVGPCSGFALVCLGFVDKSAWMECHDVLLKECLDCTITPFLPLLCMGSTCMSIAIFMLSFDEGATSWLPRQLNVACMLSLWFSLLG